MTPLVDVIFLLLLFFMLSSTFSRFGQVEIDAPATGGGTNELPQALLKLSADGLYLNGKPVPDDGLVVEAQALREKKIDRLIVMTGRDNTTQQLVSVMTDLRDIPGLSVTIAGFQ